MQSDSINTAPLKTSLLKLRRIGDAAGQVVAVQSRSEIPSIGWSEAKSGPVREVAARCVAAEPSNGIRDANDGCTDLP
jgi:hypothetical protein